MKAFYEYFRAGLTVENIGAKIKLEDEGFSLPLGFKFAVAYIPLKSKYGFLTAQVKKYSDEDMNFSIGSEYGFNVNREEAGFLRAGYAFNSENIASGINLGLGLSTKNFFIDYSFSPMGDFGSAHRLSFRIAFQKEEEEKKIRDKDSDDGYDFFNW